VSLVENEKQGSSLVLVTCVAASWWAWSVRSTTDAERGLIGVLIDSGSASRRSTHDDVTRRVQLPAPRSTSASDVCSANATTDARHEYGRAVRGTARRDARLSSGPWAKNEMGGVL